MSWKSLLTLGLIKDTVDPLKDEYHRPTIKKAVVTGNYTRSSSEQLPKRPRYEYRPDYTYSS